MGIAVDGEEKEITETTIKSAEYKSLYTCVSRTVTYDTGNGSDMTNETVDTFTKFNLASAPTKAGSTFKGWIDENGTTNQAGAEYTMPGHDTTFTAKWEETGKATVTVVASPAEGGTVTGGGNYDVGASVKIKATPAEGYHFVKWNDNVVTAERTITVPEGGVTYTATFEKGVVPTATVTVKSSSSAGGTVTGGGTYNVGATATVIATANDGYEFVQWSDGSKDATHTFTVTGDVTLTATFKEKSPGPTPVPGSDGTDPVMLVIWFFVAFLFACIIGGAIYQEYKESQQKK